MEETANTDVDGHLSSAAAFVEGGIQDACDDACSICLEEFVESDPSTVTSCKHEFHLQCILEWCQRSSQCPMCWQPVSLKDPTSQELLEAVERERSIRVNRSRNPTIFHHPALGNFELQHLPVGANDADLEERIIQHLAAAAAMGRAHHIARREGQRGRSAAHGRTQFLVLSSHPNAPTSGSVPASSAQSGGEESTPVSSTSVTLVAAEESPNQAGHTIPGQADRLVTLPSGSTASAVNSPGVSNSRNLAALNTPVSQDRAGPSDFHSFSESLKSRLNSVSMRYKESITKSTRGWKERFFSRNTSMADLGSEVRREVNAGIATVSRMMERLDTRDNSREAGASTQQIIENHPVSQLSNERVTTNHTISLPNDDCTSTSCAASSAPN